jgi:hypothetical protein
MPYREKKHHRPTARPKTEGVRTVAARIARCRAYLISDYGTRLDRIVYGVWYIYHTPPGVVGIFQCCIYTTRFAMPLARIWTKIERVEDIPKPIREAFIYAGRDYNLDNARRTDDGLYIGLWFSHGQNIDSHLWKWSQDAWVLWREAKDGYTLKVNHGA